MAFSSGDVLTAAQLNDLNITSITTTGASTFKADQDITDFTDDSRGIITLYNSDGAVDDFTCLDFDGNSTDPAARIGMKYTSGGSELHIGTSNSYAAGITNTALVINNVGAAKFLDGTAALPSITFQEDGDTGIFRVSTNRIGFATAGTQKAALTSSGYFFIGTTGGTDMPSNDGFLSVKSSAGPVVSFYRTNSVSSNVNSWFVSDYSATGTIHCKIYNDGDIQNTNNSYGSLSDVRLKEVSAARDYYEDLRKLEVVNYKFIKRNKVTYEYDDEGNQTEAEPTMELVDTDPESQKKLLGLVAQDVEKIMPGLVGESDDGYKNLKYSVLTPMLLQAFQKLADKVEALEG